MIEPGFDIWRDQADRLTPLATAYRYPGPLGAAEPEEVREALDDSRTILRQVLAYLPRDIHPEAIENL